MARIALVLPSLQFGGTERVMITLAAEFAKLGHRVSFVLMDARGELLNEVRTGVAVHSLQAARIRDAYGALVTHLGQHEYDAVFANLWPLSAMVPWSVWRARSMARVAVIEHCPLSAQYADWGWRTLLALRASLRLTLPRAAARIAVSEAVAGDLAALSGLGRQCITVIPNPIAVRPVSASERAAAEAQWQPGLRRVLSVGRLKPEKNHAMLIRAVAQLQAHVPAQLGLLGAGPEEQRLRAVAEAEGVADRVLFLGHGANPFAWYRSADCFALSSDFEGFGNVLVEAMACAVPIVSTDCLGGPRDILKGGKFGTLVPVGDAKAMAAALRDALKTTDHDPAALLARAADFAPGKIAQTYLAAVGISS